MTSIMNREDWYTQRSHWTEALVKAARAIGTKAPLYRILGSVAWGRFDGEPAPNETKDNIVFGAGFLQGVRFAALQAGRECNLEGTHHLERIWDRLHILAREEHSDAPR